MLPLLNYETSICSSRKRCQTLQTIEPMLDLERLSQTRRCYASLRSVRIRRCLLSVDRRSVTLFVKTSVGKTLNSSMKFVINRRNQRQLIEVDLRTPTSFAKAITQQQIVQTNIAQVVTTSDHAALIKLLSKTIRPYCVALVTQLEEKQ